MKRRPKTRAGKRRRSTKTGAALKARAFAALRVHRLHYIRRMQRALLEYLLTHGSGTVHDIRDAVPLPDDINPVCVGPVPNELAEARIIKRVRYAVTRRAKSHGRPVSLWKLIDPDAAREWRATHPSIDLPPQLEAEPDAETSDAAR
jgi:hypothetical protein